MAERKLLYYKHWTSVQVHEDYIHTPDGSTTATGQHVTVITIFMHGGTVCVHCMRGDHDHTIHMYYV